MKRIYLIIARGLLAVFAIGLFLACEDEINTTGSGLVDSISFDTNVSSDFSVVAYTQNYPQGVQTNGVPVGVLGIYDDPIYGRTTASFLSQVTLSRFNPDFGENAVVDSVVLTMPYLSSVGEIDENGNNVFELDSVFGNIAPLNLSVYRSDFFLNDLDPNSGFEDGAVFFSNDISSPSGAINQSLVESELLQVALDDNGVEIVSERMKLSAFEPDNSEIILTTPILDDDGNIPDNPVFEESERLPPSLRVQLDTDYWQEVIINQEGSNELLNTNSFNDYFRGLYFDIEGIQNNAFYTFFDLAATNITIYYTFEGVDVVDDDSGTTTTLDGGTGDITLSLAGVSLVDYQNEFFPAIEDELNNSDEVNGEDNLYIKGGDGSIAIIDLFGPRVDIGDGEELQNELEVLRSCGLIVNEANLIFYVDQEDAIAGLGEAEPERVFIYDVDNNITLFDNGIDASVGVGGPVNTRVNHLGRLTRSEEGDLASPGDSYRIRITQHINNIINNDSTNVRLGLAVSQNVTLVNTALIAEPQDTDSAERVPVSSVISPEGTILHGNLSTNEEKRLRLRIFYTLTEEISPDSPCGILLGL